MNFSKILLVITCIFVSGCQTFDSGRIDSIPDRSTKTAEDERRTSMNTFGAKLSLIADQLTAFKKFDHKNKTTLVTTFVWSDTLTYKKMDHPLQFLGHQLAQGIKTGLVQRSAKVVEHKSATSVAISKNASYFLSRDIKSLANKSNAEYIVAGTLTEMEGGAMVNVEVVELETSEVVAVAREFFPSSFFWQANHVSSRDGKLYRSTQMR